MAQSGSADPQTTFPGHPEKPTDPEVHVPRRNAGAELVPGAVSVDRQIRRIGRGRSQVADGGAAFRVDEPVFRKEIDGSGIFSHDGAGRVLSVSINGPDCQIGPGKGVEVSGGQGITEEVVARLAAGAEDAVMALVVERDVAAADRQNVHPARDVIEITQHGAHRSDGHILVSP